MTDADGTDEGVDTGYGTAAETGMTGELRAGTAAFLCEPSEPADEDEEIAGDDAERADEEEEKEEAEEEMGARGLSADGGLLMLGCRHPATPSELRLEKRRLKHRDDGQHDRRKEGTGRRRQGKRGV